MKKSINDNEPTEGSGGQTEEGVPDVYTKPKEETDKFVNALPMARVITHTEVTDKLKKQMAANPQNYRYGVSVNQQVNAVAVGMDNIKNSRWGVIGDVARNMPGNSPYKVRGTNGKITVSNSKANQAPVASYTWSGGNGELMSFEVTDEYITSIVDVSVESGIDGDTKEVVTNTTQSVSNPAINYYDGMVIWPENENLFNPPIPQPETYQQDKTRVKKNDFSVYDATQEIVSVDLKVKTAANSEKEVIDKTEKEYQATQAEVDEYLTRLRARYDLSKNLDNVEAYQELLRNGNNLEDYVVKKKTHIKKKVFPTNYVSTNANNPDSSSSDWVKGYKHLASQQDIIIVEKTPKSKNSYYKGYRPGEDIWIVQEVEVKVPISGARILSSPFVTTSTIGKGNDVVKKTENQVTATATVLGNPSLECSMVAEVLNVSNMYSGDWYTTKVTHSWSAGAEYSCSIDFQKKTKHISKVNYSQKIPTQKLYKSINQSAQETLITGNYLIYPTVKAYVEKMMKSSQLKGSVRIDVISKSPLTIGVYDASVSFNASKPLFTRKINETKKPE